MKFSEREPYLQALDTALSPLGFNRSKRSYEWKHSIDVANTEWIHCNFGLGVINPSFGVRYSDLAELVPTDVGAVVGVICMLAPISGVSYSSATAPTLLAEHVLTVCIPHLRNLRNREAVIHSLETTDPKKWPVFGASHRMRLLPLLLAGGGQITEALEWLTRFEQAAPTMDQQIPKYAVFAKYLREKYVG